MKKCIVYLGGSITQSANFEYLKKKKIYTILIDVNLNCYCRKYADQYINCSQTDTKKIIIKLKKIIFSENLKVIDCFGVAHYSYPALNIIKKTFIKNYKKDNFLLHKHIQKQKLLDLKITPKYFKLPSKNEFSKNKKIYMNKIFEFAKSNNFKLFIKPSSTHQGVGITEIKKKFDKKVFNKKFYPIILNTYEYCNHLYIEQKVEGRLINIDIIKNENDQIIFLPAIFRDKITFTDKRKYLSVYQYISNENIIQNKDLNKLKKIFVEVFPKKKIFATLDCIINNNKLYILELSPHFHNSKVFKFLNNNYILDLYFKKKLSKITQNLNKISNLGGYLYILNNNRSSKKIVNVIKTNSSKIHIDNIDISKRKKFFKKYAFVEKKFLIIYFMCKNNNKLRTIENILEKNKNNIYK
tara:strand:- start:7790 stop:9022 length:1233 start_codon:yes stop_codon:yes gene_type:complete